MIRVRVPGENIPVTAQNTSELPYRLLVPNSGTIAGKGLIRWCVRNNDTALRFGNFLADYPRSFVGLFRLL